MKFESLNLNPDILKGIIDAGFEHCTPIQEQSLPECLKGKDVIAQSQTGSGKTAVFLLTIFSRILAAGPSPTGKPRALVMVPTRELATQVIDDSVKLAKYLPFKSVAIYGGVEYNKQIHALKTGVDLVVATPGRMIDLYKSKTLSLDNIDIFVIDEADRMFDMGFAPDIMYIAGHLPKKKPRQTMLFSATIDDNVSRLASRYMNPEPVIIEIEPEQVTVNSIDQKVIYVSNEEKVSVLLTLLKRAEVERSIIFTNMKRTAEMLGWKLAANGLPAKVLTGDVSQERRHKIIENMKSGQLKILVATDVAARGLHIEGITHVFNYDLPDDAANYVHRIGRTARAGKSGKAYSLVCEDHALSLPDIEKYIEQKIESEWIEDSEMLKDTAPRFHQDRSARKKPPERSDKRPGASFRDKRIATKTKKDHPHPVVKKDDAAVREKRAGQQRVEKKRFSAVKKETESDLKGERPQRPARPRHGRYDKGKFTKASQPVVIKPEAARPKQIVPENSETTPKKAKEKTGILKRFLNFLKKE